MAETSSLLVCSFDASIECIAQLIPNLGILRTGDEKLILKKRTRDDLAGWTLFTNFDVDVMLSGINHLYISILNRCFDCFRSC